MNIFSENDLTAVQDVIQKTNGQGNHHIKKGDPPKDEVTSLNQQTERIQELIEEIDSLPDPKSRKLMSDCIHEMLSFYGVGLERILKIVSNGNSAAAKDIYNDLIEDSVINGLLLIHDLHPLDLKTRLHKALDKVKPYIDSHGGSVEIISLENGVATLKLAGTCRGCPSSSSTLELGIKEAIEEFCPDLLGLEVEGLPSPFAAEKNAGEPGWSIINGLGKLPNGSILAVESRGIPLIVCRVNNQLYAYRNFCTACERPFTNGTLNANILACQLGHAYDVQHAGICTNDADMHLDPYPLLEEAGIVKIAVG